MHKSQKIARGLSLLALVASGWTAVHADPVTYEGDTVALGNGTVGTYLTLNADGTPMAIGVRFTETALEGLPAEPNNTTRCFDKNGDGNLEAGVECAGEYEYMMAFPPEAANAGLPFKWMEVDWNAHGHGPPNVYDKPHFDTHFYMVDREQVDAIRPGPCGIVIDCEDFKRAQATVPETYLPAGYIDVGAAVAAMGNHLVNPASPELADPPGPFTHTFIYGAYDGHITFMEPMMTRNFLLTKPDVCAPIAQPPDWGAPGQYPTKYCVRYVPEETAYTVSLEGFKGHNIAME